MTINNKAADTTNGCITLTVTGPAATTVTWVAVLDQTEVILA